jgi:putative hemolysin
MLQRIPPLRPRLICVDSFARRHGGSRTNLHALRAALRHLGDGGALLLFPGGRVSHFRWKHLRVTDPDWTTQAVRLARRSGANVLLVRVKGANSWRFQLAGMLHPLFRTLLLLREFYRRVDRMSVRLALRAVPHDDPALCEGSEESAIATLRDLTYGMDP